MKEIIVAAQEIEEVLNNDSKDVKVVDDADESLKGNVKKYTIQHKRSKCRMIVQDIETITNVNAKKSRLNKKATTNQDKEIKYAKSLEDVNESVKDCTQMSTEDKELNENLPLHNELQELAAEHEQKSVQDIKDLEIEDLQEHQYDNNIEIEVPLQIPQIKELFEAIDEFQGSIDKCQYLSATETSGQEIGLREVEPATEIEPIEKMENPIEDKQAIQLVQDAQTIEETFIPFEYKQKEEFKSPIEETKETIQETIQSIDETTQPIKETTQSLEDATQTIEETTQSVEETTQPVEETTQPIEDTTQPSQETSQSIEDEVKHFECTKATTMKDIPKSVFEKFYTAHTSYIGNKEKGEYRCISQCCIDN